MPWSFFLSGGVNGFAEFGGIPEPGVLLALPDEALGAKNASRSNIAKHGHFADTKTVSNLRGGVEAFRRGGFAG